MRAADRLGHWSPDQAQNEQQDDRPNRRDNQTANQTTTRRNAERAEDEASQQGSDNSDDNVAENAEPTAFHQFSSQPTRGQANQNKPYEIHDHTFQPQPTGLTLGVDTTQIVDAGRRALQPSA
jgi:hypothetical protein